MYQQIPLVQNWKKQVVRSMMIVLALLLCSRSFVAEASIFVITPSTGTATIVTPTSGSTNNWLPFFSGTGSLNGDTVTLSYSGGSTIGTTTVVTTGNFWIIVPTASIAAGTHTVCINGWSCTPFTVATYTGSSWSRDTSFNSGGAGAWGPIYSVVMQPDGKFIIGWAFQLYNGVSRGYIARLNSDGSLDTSFTPSPGANGFVYNSTVQADGKIIVVGNFDEYNGVTKNYIVRVHADGSIDTSFNSGAVAANGFVSVAVVQPDGKIVIGGRFSTYNGTSRGRIARLNSDGSLDTSFDPGSGAVGTAAPFIDQMELLADGKIVIGGDFTTYNGTSRNRIARLNSDGSLDTSFDPGVGADGHIDALAMQSDGKFIIGGDFTGYNSVSRNRIARINSDGSLDTSFDPGAGTNNTVDDVKIQSDGKIIVAGNFTTYSGSSINRIVRVNTNGSIDTSFNAGSGANDHIGSLVIQPDGKIVIGGLFTTYYNSTSVLRIARIATDSTAPVITLNGSANVSLTIGATYTELGATWVDNADGTGDATVTGTVNTAVAGTYTITYTQTDIAGNIATPVTRTVTVSVANSGGWGGGWGGSVVVDNCPNGDYSPSYYDSLCGTAPTTTWNTNNSWTITTGSMTTSWITTTTITDTDELRQAYNYAFANNITTMNTFEKANMMGTLKRAHLAKMLSEYAAANTDNEINTSLTCEFPDIANQNVELQWFIKEACQRGLMGVNIERFNPNGEVTRAEFGTAFSRLLFGDVHNGGNPYYINHLQALNDADIMNNISNPSMIEIRGYVMLMMMRSAQ